MTMYLEHFGLREAPFRITPHTEFFFAGANRGATLEALVYAITAGEGLVKVTGEVGTGKTMLSRVLMERLPETVEVIYLAVPSLTRDEMLLAIASELGVQTPGANTTQLLRGLQERLIALHAEGHQVVVLIDEAHAMPLGTLEEIRLLSNLETGKEKLLQIVLFGQPELDEHLALPNMRQLKERITHAFGLDPLPPRDIKDYINFRLRAAGYHGPDLFGTEALRIIAEASEGLTRRINIYADKTLLAAFAAGTHTVSPDHARAAVSDTQIVVTPGPSSRRAWVAAAAGVVAGIAIGYGIASLQEKAGPAPAPSASGAVKPAPAPAVAPASVEPAPVTPAAAVAAASPDSAPAAPPVSVTSPASPVSVTTPTSPASVTAPTSPASVTAPTSPASVTAPASPASLPPAGTPSPSAPPAPPATKPAAPAAPASAMSPAPAPSPALAPAKLAGNPAKVAAPSKPAWSAPVESRLSAGLSLLENKSDTRFAIQLMMTDAKERGYLEYYLAEATRKLKLEELYLYPSGTSEAPKMGVLYGTFGTRQEANAAIEALPANLRQFRPYVRPLEAVRSDVRRPPVS